MDRVLAMFTAGPEPTRDEITRAFWGACHGGQRKAAEYLLGKGADINWVEGPIGNADEDSGRIVDGQLGPNGR